jgi:hypothetical protein
MTVKTELLIRATPPIISILMEIQAIRYAICLVSLRGKGELL